MLPLMFQNGITRNRRAPFPLPYAHAMLLGPAEALTSSEHGANKFTSLRLASASLFQTQISLKNDIRRLAYVRAHQNRGHDQRLIPGI